MFGKGKKDKEQNSPCLKFEVIKTKNLNNYSIHRAKVPGGWLVSAHPMMNGGGTCFIPDHEHKWDGNSLG